jgi:hypothetical protein
VSASDPGDVARLREALASLAGTDGGKDGGSADAGRIFDALHGNLEVEERRAIVDELVTDPDAAEAWRLARELAPEPRAASTAGRLEPWKWLSMAAALVLVVGLGWRLFSPGKPEDLPVYRSGDERAIASTLPVGAPLPRAQPVLRWTPVPGARYRVRVLTPELQVLVERGELTTPEYTLSPDVLRRIEPGAAILWQVEGRVPGSAVVTSPTFSVRLE